VKTSPKKQHAYGEEFKRNTIAIAIKTIVKSLVMSQTQVGETPRIEAPPQTKVFLTRARIWSQAPKWTLVPVEGREELAKYIGHKTIVEILPGIRFIATLHREGPHKLPSIELPRSLSPTWEELWRMRSELNVRIIVLLNQTEKEGGA